MRLLVGISKSPPRGLKKVTHATTLRSAGLSEVSDGSTTGNEFKGMHSFEYPTA